MSTTTWSKDGTIATIQLARADKRNAMGMAFWDEFPAVVDEVCADPEVRVIIVAGDGRDFTVGLDLVETAPFFMKTAQRGVAGRAQVMGMVKKMQHAFNVLEETDIPVITAVHGWCIGAGIDLITAADIRLGTADSRYSVRETKVAIVADLGTLQRLQKVIPRGIAAEWALTGKDVNAAEAHRVGLLNHVYADQETLMAEATKMAQEIASNSPLSVRGTKAVMRYSADRPTSEGLTHVALWNTAYLHSEDLMEAITAFQEKRAPQFRGR